MHNVRKTFTLPAGLCEDLEANYRHLGFARVGDLVAEAIRDYLHRRCLEEKNASMERAAADPDFLSLLREVSADFAAVDAENLPPAH